MLTADNPGFVVPSAKNTTDCVALQRPRLYLCAIPKFAPTQNYTLSDVSLADQIQLQALKNYLHLQ